VDLVAARGGGLGHGHTIRASAAVHQTWSAGAVLPEAERIAGRRAALAAVDPAVLPLTAGTVGTTASWIGAEQFGWGLAALLGGVAALGAG
jgi:hypothetical protein